MTLPRRIPHLHSVVGEHRHQRVFSSDDDEETNGILNPPVTRYSTVKCDKATATSPQVETATPVAVGTSNTSANRFKHLCSKLKRRLTIHREHRAHAEELRDTLTDRRRSRFGRYKSFSSSVTDEESVNDFDWPDFEKVYDSIPLCLINALPGIDDFHMDDVEYREDRDRLSSLADDDDDDDERNYEDPDDVAAADEDIHFFRLCKRGSVFRRNAVCQKLDKTHYHGQLDTFIQQLMIEKLMRTWT